MRRRCGPQPYRRIEHEPVDLVIVVGRVSADDHGPPRPAQETELRHTSPLENEVDCGTDILHSHISRDDRRIVGGWLIHFRRTR